MPRDRTDVVRRSLFGAGTPPSGNQDGEPGERRTNAKPNRNTESRGAERSQNRSPIRETAAVSPPPTRGRSVERTAVTVPTDLLMRVHDGALRRRGVHGTTRAPQGRTEWRPRVSRNKQEDSYGPAAWNLTGPGGKGPKAEVGPPLPRHGLGESRVAGRAPESAGAL